MILILKKLLSIFKRKQSSRGFSILSQKERIRKKVNWNIEYKTRCKVVKKGRHIFLDLRRNTNLPGSKQNKHITILTNEKKGFSNRQLIEISKYVKSYLKKRRKSVLTFYLEPYGSHALKISGEVLQLVNSIRKNYSHYHYSKDGFRTPHITCFNNNDKFLK